MARVNGKHDVAALVPTWTFQQQATVLDENEKRERDADATKTGGETYEGKMWELCHYRILRINLLVLVVCWMSCSFGFYMLAYVLKYLNGDIFLNAYSVSAGEIIGKLSTIFLLRCTSLKRVFLIAFGMSSLGSLLLVIFRD